MVAAEVIDGVGSSIRVELNRIVGASSKIAKEPDEGTVVNVTRTYACFCKFAHSKEDISSCIVGKVEECADC